MAASDREMSSVSRSDSVFDAWLEAYRGIAIKVVRSFAPESFDISDLQQELLQQLWFSRASYAGQAKLSTWI